MCKRTSMSKRTYECWSTQIAIYQTKISAYEIDVPCLLSRILSLQVNMVKHDYYSINTIVNNTIDKSIDFMTLIRTIYKDLTVNSNFRRNFFICIRTLLPQETKSTTDVFDMR